MSRTDYGPLEVDRKCVDHAAWQEIGLVLVGAWVVVIMAVVVVLRI